MKKLLILVLFPLVIGISTAAWASPIDPVSFFLVDKDSGGVTLGISHFNLSDVTDLTKIFDLDLEYSKDNGSTWADATSSVSFPSPLFTGGKLLTSWRINNNAGFDTSGALLFDGEFPVLTGEYSSLRILWEASPLQASFITPTPADAVAPVPIPGAAILFGSGLLAVVGFRRKANS